MTPTYPATRLARGSRWHAWLLVLAVALGCLAVGAMLPADDRVAAEHSVFDVSDQQDHGCADSHEQRGDSVKASCDVAALGLWTFAAPTVVGVSVAEPARDQVSTVRTGESRSSLWQKLSVSRT